MKQTAPFGNTISVFATTHPAVAYLYLVRPQAAMQRLVIQFAANGLRAYEDLVALEQQLLATSPQVCDLQLQDKEEPQ
jgi:hypothetical protein